MNPESAIVRRRLVISGRVQAVGFRYSCQRRAVEVGLRGWVRNLPDGRVEAAFEGPGPSVDALVGWCHSGPPLAHVTTVAVADEPPEGDTAFVVR